MITRLEDLRQLSLAAALRAAEMKQLMHRFDGSEQISAAAMSSLAYHATKVIMDHGTKIFTQDSLVEFSFFLLSGRVRLTRGRRDGRETLLGTMVRFPLQRLALHYVTGTP